MKIKSLSARKILDSSGAFIIETTCILDDGSIGVAAPAGGLSKGTYEAENVEPDLAIKNIKMIAEKVIGLDLNPSTLDQFLLKLDGSDKKSNLGCNAILSTSIAFIKAFAKSKGLETYEVINALLDHKISNKKLIKYKRPQMLFLMMEGGLHGSGHASIQEFMAIVDDIKTGVEIYNNIKKDLHNKKISTNVGAEGAFSPSGLNNEQILEILSKHLKGQTIALDVAANSFLELKQALPDYQALIDDFPIVSIEDPFFEDDIKDWKAFADFFLNKINVVGDDLTTTNPKRLKMAIDEKLINAIIIKPNQIGTVSETLEVIKMAKENNIEIIVSHRGTDTNDDFIADLAIGAAADYTKFGSPARGERVAKYNRLSEILEKLDL